jgi:hypothetical protein
MASSSSFQDDNGWASIIKTQGDMFNTPDNPNRVFSRGSTYDIIRGERKGSEPYDLKDKTEDMNDCGNRGATLCNRDSNCDGFQYHRDPDNKYSYCQIFKFVDTVNPENDADVQDNPHSTFWIKDSINL